MLRKLYFILALLFAACFTFGGVGGVIYEAYLILNEMNSDGSTSQYMGWALTSLGAVGYVVCSWLFVNEDDKDDTDPEDEPSPQNENPSI